MKKAGILIVALVLLAGFAPLRAADPITKKQFRQDLAFYNKTAQEKTLNANDRLFILNRLREKYNAAKFDITELYGEIDKWSAMRIKEWKAGEKAGQMGTQPAADSPAPIPSAEPAPAQNLAPTADALPPGAKTSAAAAKLSKLLISQSAGKSVLTLNVPGLEEYKEVPVEGDGTDNPSAAVIYLYNTKNTLPAALQVLKPKKGFIREVQVKRVTSKPPTIKVSTAFRKNYPYDIERSGDKLILSVYDTVPQRQAQAPTPQEAIDAAPEAGPPETPKAPLQSGPLEPEPFTLHGASQPIEPGQILAADFVKYPDFNRTTVVAPDGQVHIPPAGQTLAAGLTAEQLGGSAAKKIEDSFLKGAVKITAKDFDPKNRVALIGCVKNEGVYTFAEGMSCYELISRSGGFALGANKKAVLIHRLTKQSRKKLKFDVAAFADSSQPVDDFHLEPGDVVEVQKIPAVYAFGEVRSGDFYKLKEPATLTQMLTTAGGLTNRADANKIFLIREEEGQNMKRSFNLDQIKSSAVPDPAVREGDIIYVQPMSGKSKMFNKETISWGAFFMSLGLVLALLV